MQTANELFQDLRAKMLGDGWFLQVQLASYDDLRDLDPFLKSKSLNG
jgi:hypothetical protein